jgi:hypothetical protein
MVAWWASSCAFTDKVLDWMLPKWAGLLRKVLPACVVKLRVAHIVRVEAASSNDDLGAGQNCQSYRSAPKLSGTGSAVLGLCWSVRVPSRRFPADGSAHHVVRCSCQEPRLPG